MDIIKLKEPWCFNIGDLTEDEIEELYSHFVSKENYSYTWSHADTGSHVGIDWRGTSNYFGNIESFDEYDIEDNVAVYTIEELRNIIAEHLAKQPVEKLEDGIVYHSEHSKLNYLFVKEKEWINLSSKMFYEGGVSWDDMHQSSTHVITKATPEQIAHYEACVKAGKYVEPESVTQFVVGKWYKYDKGRYFKYKSTMKQVGYNQIYYSERIVGKNHSVSCDYIASNDFEKHALEHPVEDLSEIQDLLPEGHTDKWVKTTPKSERYLATMKFFEQLREPERSEAIANYDEEYSVYAPKSLEQAISGGFCWDDTEQENDYWEHIHGKLLDTTYFKEELLVFSKYKVGDIVVKTSSSVLTETLNGPSYLPIGIILKVGDKSTKECLMYSEHESTNPKDWRPATPEEVDAYNQGVRNIANIKPKQDKRAVKFNSEEERRHILAHFNPCSISLSGVNTAWICLDDGAWSSEWEALVKDNYTEVSFQDWCKEFNHTFDYKEAVHCTTQEEWNFVLSKFNPSELTSEDFKEEGSQSTITIENTNDSCLGCYANVEYDVQQGFTILTFKQWCEKYSHSYEAVPEYVECVKSHQSPCYTVGKIYTWPNTISNSGKSNKIEVLKGSVWEFKPSTKEAYDKQQEKFKMEELLSEAKRRYPAGTKVRAVVDGPKLTTEIFTLANSHYWASGSQAPSCKTEEGRFVALYLAGMWAEIVKEEPKPAEIKPAKGMYVRCLKENSWNYGKAKVGQVFEIQNVDRAGDLWIDNQALIKERLKAGEFELLPDYKEESWVAQVGDWVYITEGEKHGSDLKTGAIVQCTKWESDSQQFGGDLSTWTYPKHYRKATQEEIDSVTKTTASNTTEWTADNWYVEVSSQEEANAVIDAAAKMYGGSADKTYIHGLVWRYVTLNDSKRFSLLPFKGELKGRKPRPITDFIQPEIIRVPDEIDCINLRPLSPEECYKPQQDELVIYKPKQTRLVEPGAVSANVSTTNLIIKSNSKYL